MAQPQVLVPSQGEGPEQWHSLRCWCPLKERALNSGTASGADAPSGGRALNSGTASGAGAPSGAGAFSGGGP